MAQYFFEDSQPRSDTPPRADADGWTVRRFAANPQTAGPWSAEFAHGGPPNALAVTEAERLLAAHTGRTDLVALRLAAEFVGPVPVGELEVLGRVVRAARSAALVEVRIAAGGRACLLTRTWFVRATSGRPAEPEASEPSPALPPEAGSLGIDFGYGASIDWRFVAGAFTTPGPATVWARPLVELLRGHTVSGLARVALVADSASGVSAELDWGTWSFQNVDLDVHLARPFTGDWVLLDAHTQLGCHGSALARSTISDERGVAGSSLQTLVVAPR